MRKSFLLVLLTLMACANSEETTTIPVRYMETDDAVALIAPYLPGGDEAVRASAEPRALTVTGPAARVRQVEEVLRTYDRPRPNVTLRFQLIEADGFDDVDPAIADVTEVLRPLFRFDGYRLVGETLVQSGPRSHLTQRLAAGGQRYEVRGAIGDVVVAADRAAVELTVDLVLDGASLVQTALTLPGGQTAVVGSARAQADGRTLILVVRSEVR